MDKILYALFQSYNMQKKIRILFYMIVVILLVFKLGKIIFLL